jgi:leader peptidase (prepilin peptidase)/N-methyltransferase
VTETILLVAAGALAGPRIRAVVLRHGAAAPNATRSGCPACLRRLLPERGLFAVLSPDGRCPGCRTRIGPAAGAVELTGAGVFALLAGGGRLPVLAGCWLAAASLALVLIDAQVHRLPDAVTLPTASGLVLLLGLAALAWPDEGALPRAVLGAATMAAGFVVLATATPTGLGLGDGKLALALGAGLGWVGWPALVLGTVLGFALAALYGLALVLAGRAGRRQQIPFGPFMLIGAFAVLIRP